MKEKIKNYIVSSADWELEVDDISEESAAISAVIFAFNKFGKRLLMSTVIMVNRKERHLNDEIIFAEFFATHKILKDIGLKSMSENFKELSNNINENKYS
jgi:hypothetical protein